MLERVAMQQGMKNIEERATMVGSERYFLRPAQHAAVALMKAARKIRGQ